MWASVFYPTFMWDGNPKTVIPPAMDGCACYQPCSSLRLRSHIYVGIGFVPHIYVGQQPKKSHNVARTRKNAGRRRMLSAVDLDHFANELDGRATPQAVLNALHEFSHPVMNAYGAWRLPLNRDDLYVEGKNVWFHASVPPAYIEEFWPLARKFGPSPMSTLVQQRHKLVTWGEGMRELALRGQESWLFDLARRHGMRDGAYVPQGAWMINYWSPKVLRGLSTRSRACLFMAAGFVCHRMETLIGPEKINNTVVAGLTARQLSALRLVSRGHTLAEIAARMEVGTATVRDYLEGARKKLGARDATHAAFQALRLHLIA